MKGFVRSAIDNPATTSLGILIFLSAVISAAIAILDNDPLTTPDWSMVIQALVGLACVIAKDGWRFWEKPKDKK
jgi:hypothetical protein